MVPLRDSLFKFLVCFGPLAFAQQKVGFILDIRGQWTDGESQVFVKLGQLLPGESLLANRTPSTETASSLQTCMEK